MTIERLSQLDLIMLGASRRWPQDIGAIAVFDGADLLDEAAELETVRRAIAARLHLIPRFRQVIHTPPRGLGGPFWADDPGFDLREHVRMHRVEPPGGESELLEAVEELRSRRLDPGRPLWDMWLLTGLAGQQVGLFVRIHHAIADGMAAMATVATFLDPAPDTPVTPPLPWRPAPWPSRSRLLGDTLRRHGGQIQSWIAAVVHPMRTARRFRDAWPAIRDLFKEAPAAETSLSRMVGADRHLALARSRLDLVKSAGHAHDATVNDVLLTVTAGGVRALFQSRGEPVEGTTVRTYVPISLRERLPLPQQGNLIAQMIVPLRLDEPDPARRLDEIAGETRSRKTRTPTSLGVLMRTRLARALMLRAAMSRRVNLTTASIAGPPTHLYLAGARMLEVFPVIPLIADEPLGVGALSYAGGLFIGIVADRDAVPDLAVLSSAVGEELRQLQSLAGTQPEVLVASTTGGPP